MVETADVGPYKLREHVVLERCDFVPESRKEGPKVDIRIGRHVCVALESMVLARFTVLQYEQISHW